MPATRKKRAAASAAPKPKRARTPRAASAAAAAAEEPSAAPAPGDGRPRCDWLPSKWTPNYVDYHDTEWGVPVRGDDRKLFEMLCLEGQQAGLSWLTILNKREGYRRAFADFDPAAVARFTKADEAWLLQNPEIVRNKLKVAAIVTNARAYAGVVDEFGSLDAFLWGMVRESPPAASRFTTYKQMPTKTPLSTAMSAALKARGFKFVGPVACYAFMQAVGMVNDHTVGCFRRGGG